MTTESAPFHSMSPLQRPTPTIALALLAPVVGCAKPDAPPMSAVLVTLDTTNRTALDCYGKDHGVTPYLAQLAAESLVFDRARSVAPITLVSHASMLTGLYPLRHTVHDNGLVPLPSSAVTLAERAHDAGYETAAFLAAAVLAAPYGLDQGFDVYDAPQGASEGAAAHILDRSGAEVTERALAWLNGRDASRPFFLWVHYFDPHAPCEAPSEFLERANGRPYLGEIARMDDAVGDLVAALRVHGLLDETWVVVAGDHGESLGRHGEETHSILCYDTTLDVPLFVRFPDGLRAGERSDAPVSVADVYPTLIDALDLGGAEDVDGISLLGDPDPDRGVYFESYAGFLNHGWSPLVGWANAAGKYLHSSAPELYDESDANEQHNLWPAESQRAERYTRALDALARRPKLAVSEADRLREDVSDSVRALGYAGAGDPDAEIPPPLADTGLPAPASRMGELKAYYDATLLSLAGRDDDAIAAMRAVIAENQRNFAALEMLAGFLRETGRDAEAVEVLDQLIALGSNRLRTHDTLGHALEALGELERAADHFRLALERLPSDPHQAADVARLEGRLSGDR